MTIETTAQPAESTAASVIDNRPPPKNDFEAAQREAEDAARSAAKEPAQPANTAAATGDDGAAKPDGEPGKQSEGKKNRTGIYINRLQEENRRLREQLASNGGQAHDARQPQAATARGAEEADAEPTLEQFDYDIEKYTRAHTQWGIRNAQKTSKAEAEAATARESQQQMFDSYNERLAAFEAEHPDFQEAVNSIEYDLSREVGLAILAHERGPEIAYYIANNDDEAFNLANTLPQNAAKAVDRLIKRMDAAQQASQPDPQRDPEPADPVTAALKAANANPAAKPISKAPAPTPTVAGRSVVKVPPEKQTDDDWYKADKERRRKR
jgi:hypothetical protein